METGDIDGDLKIFGGWLVTRVPVKRVENMGAEISQAELKVFRNRSISSEAFEARVEAPPGSQRRIDECVE